MREEGEATLLAKADCTEIERVKARVLLSEAVARPSKRASWLFQGLTVELLATTYRCISLNNFLFRSASIVASIRLCVIAAARSPISR